MKVPSILFVFCLSLAYAATVTGCAAADAPNLDGVKAFDAYRVYYPGEEVAGFSLKKVEGEEWQKMERSIGWSFYYGQCDPPPTGDSGCAPPLQIHDYSICRRWPTTFGDKPKLFNFRGAKATGNGEIDNPLEVFTGRTTVVISARDPSVARVAGRQLRNVREAQPLSLAPPVPDSLWGKLPCQAKPR
jgi:hypothetical protein